MEQPPTAEAASSEAMEVEKAERLRIKALDVMTQLREGVLHQDPDVQKAIEVLIETVQVLERITKEANGA